MPPLAQHGRLPLHYAIEEQAGPEVVLALLPSDVAAKDSTQSYLLLKEFKERREQVLPVLLADVSAQVLRLPKSEHSTAVDGDKEIADTFYSWSKLVSGTQDMCIEIVRAILEKYNDDVQMLVDLCDKDGRKAVDIATPKCKALLLSCTQLCGRYTISLNPPEHRSATSVVLRAEDHSPHDFSDIFDEFDRNKNGKLEPKEIADAALSLGICAKLLQGSDQAVSRDEFVSACTKLIGDGPRQVVIKLMQDQTQWKREKDARANNMLDNKFVVQALEGPAEAAIAKAVRAGEGGLKHVKDKFLPQEMELGKYAIIMDAADRNLHQIFHQERPDLNSIRTILQQVFEAVGHLHGKKLMHGDLKLLNIVRFRLDNRLRLIDLDAAATIDCKFDKDESYAGAKFSSGNLPPELWYCASKEDICMLKEYWKDCDLELHKKVKPLEEKQKYYVVKSFRSGNDGKPICHGLPYKMVKASEAIDAWALGVIAFLLLTGEAFVPSTRDDDCTSGKAAGFVCDWGKDLDDVEYHMQKIEDDAGRDFVSRLLRRDPLKRLKAHKALNHVFLNPKASDADAKMTLILKHQKKLVKSVDRIEKGMIELKHLANETLQQVKRSEEVLRKAVFESTEILTPTCFVILPHKLGNGGNAPENDGGENFLAFQDLLGISDEAVSLVEADAEESDAEGDEEGGQREEEPEEIKSGSQGEKKTTGLCANVAKTQRKAALVKANMKSWFSSKIFEKPVYLYLVDEVTGKPVPGDGPTYPIRIDSPKEKIRELAPLMYLAVSAMSLVNNGAGVARMFGIPWPKMPKAALKKFANTMSKANTAEQFDCLQASIGDVQQIGTTISQDNTKQMRDKTLREFVRFLADHDPENNFAGMRRVMTDGGAIVWTSETNVDPISLSTQVERAAEKESMLQAQVIYEARIHEAQSR